MVTRTPSQPVAVTAAIEPRWSYVDLLTGYRADGFATEFKILIDFALTDRVFGTVNLNYALGTQKSLFQTRAGRTARAPMSRRQ